MSNETDFLARLLAFIATFVPLAGLAATFAIAANCRGIPRYAVLIVGPLLTALLAYLVGKPAMADGNMLAAVIYSVFLLFLIIYYPLLAVIHLVIRYRRRDPGGE